MSGTARSSSLRSNRARSEAMSSEIYEMNIIGEVNSRNVRQQILLENVRKILLSPTPTSLECSPVKPVYGSPPKKSERYLSPFLMNGNDNSYANTKTKR